MSGNVRVGGGPRVPAGRFVELPSRGRTFVREQPGPAGAPTVVLLHGWTATAALNWLPSFGPLADHFRVVALDHRGHGRGLRAAVPFRLEDCADDVAALLRELRIGSCVAAGYSMGGPIAQLLWRRHPDVVAGLVLCATSATFHGTARESALSAMASGGSFVAAHASAPTDARRHVGGAAGMARRPPPRVRGRDPRSRLDQDRRGGPGDLPVRLPVLDP